MVYRWIFPLLWIVFIAFWIVHGPRRKGGR